MPIIRSCRKEGNYATSNNLYLDRKDLSGRAKAVLAYLVGRPDNWSVNVEYMANNCFKEGRKWVYAGILELEAFGYIKRMRTRNDEGKFIQIEYIVYEVPQPELITSIIENSTSPSNITKKPITNSSNAKPFSLNPIPAKPFPVLGEVATSNINKERIEKENKQTKKEVSVVSFSGSKIIGETLDEPQRQRVHEVLQSLPQQSQSLDDLTQQVIFVLLDKNAFTRAEGNFNRKLNSIAKVIREGRWEPPSAYKAKQNEIAPISEEAKKINDLKAKIVNIEHQIHSSEQAKKACSNMPALFEGHNKTIEINQNKLNELRAALQTLSPPDRNVMDAAHSLITAKVGNRVGEGIDPKMKTLKEKIRTISIQLSSSQSAMVQFKNLPDIAKEHENSVVHYQAMLAGLRLEAEKFNQSNQSNQGGVHA